MISSATIFLPRLSVSRPVGKPLFQLLHAVGIVELRQLTHGICQFCAGAGIHINSLPDQRKVDSHAAIIDFLIDVVFIPDGVRHRELL